MTVELSETSRSIEVPARVEVRVLAPLCLASFVALLFVVSLSPFLPAIAAELGVSVGMLGLAGTASLLMTACGGLLIGPLADHVGHRRAIVSGLVVLAISSAGGALASGFALFVVARLIGGWGFSAASGVTNAVAANRYTGETRRRALGIISTASIFAGIVGAPLLTTIGSWTSWRGAFAFVAITAMVSALAAWMSIPPDVGGQSSRLSLRAIAVNYQPLVQERSTLRLYGATALQMFCLIGALTYVGAFLIEQRGFSVREVGWAFMLQSVGGFVGGVLASGRAGRLPLRPLYTVAILAMGAAFLAFYTIPAAGIMLVVLLSLTGLAQIIGWISLAALLANETPIGQGSTMVLNGSVLGIGGALGTASGGLLLSLSDYSALGGLYAAAALVSAVMVWPSSHRLARQTRAVR